MRAGNDETPEVMSEDLLNQLRANHRDLSGIIGRPFVARRHGAPHLDILRDLRERLAAPARTVRTAGQRGADLDLLMARLRTHQEEEESWLVVTFA